MRSFLDTLFSLTALTFLIWVSPSLLEAQAPDFTFTVPMEFQQLSQQIERVRVRCEVSAPDGTVLGEGVSAESPIYNGSIYSSFSVTITVSPEHRSYLTQRPLNWECRAQWKPQAVTTWPSFGTDTSSDSETAPRPGTNPVVSVGGEIGWS